MISLFFLLTSSCSPFSLEKIIPVEVLRRDRKSEETECRICGRDLQC